MRTANPVLSEKTFAPADWPGYRAGAGATAMAPARAGVMTLGGTIIKTAVLLALCAVAAVVGWNMVAAQAVNPMILLLGGGLGGFVLAMIIGFKPTAAPFLAPVYAILEGAFLGAVSLLVASRVGPQGGALVFQAILLTFGIMGALLALFSVGAIRLGSTAMKIVSVATAGVCLTYLLNMVLSMFGFSGMNVIFQSGMIGIGFSLFVIVLASFNLVMDFQTIEGGVQNGAPKYMEWYAGFGLLVTLVWLYIEVLRLLAKLRRE